MHLQQADSWYQKDWLKRIRKHKQNLKTPLQKPANKKFFHCNWVGFFMGFLPNFATSVISFKERHYGSVWLGGMKWFSQKIIFHANVFPRKIDFHTKFFIVWSKVNNYYMTLTVFVAIRPPPLLRNYTIYWRLAARSILASEVKEKEGGKKKKRVVKNWWQRWVHQNEYMSSTKWIYKFTKMHAQIHENEVRRTTSPYHAVLYCIKPFQWCGWVGWRRHYLTSQSPLITGQYIGDNILLAFKQIKHHKRAGISLRYVLKVDLRKAYDSVEWPWVKKWQGWVSHWGL